VGGVMAMGGAIVILLLLPLVDLSEIRSPLFRPLYKFFVMFFFANFLLLGYLGQAAIKTPYNWVSQYATFFYFSFFVVVVLVITFVEKILSKNE
jgi:ubiquinol-cytochrome c reductase cytochrome b subunit